MNREASCQRISLFDLVNRLISTDVLSAKYSQMVRNDIPPELMVSADENMLAYVLWNLIHSAVTSIHEDSILIEALTVEDRTVIRIKDLGTYFYHSISQEYRKVQFVAEKLGGSVHINHDINHGANASFIISNSLLTA
jgi:C4-dicarboxylate-specific signal transduction histidine kinase